MERWTPITLNELFDKIQKTETALNGQFWNFWELIKIDPVKWNEKDYGNMGGGFWVVAICGTKIIWYNDIEDGFNISTYKKIGEINEYWCNQDELNIAVKKMFELITMGVNLSGRTRASF